jgi:predicted flavoprotein YhiN
MRSADVLDAFLSAARSNGWEICTGKAVCGIEACNGDTASAWTVLTEDGKSLYAQCAVIASGGITYPETGSDGSLFGILRKAGIGISEPRPALAPVYVREYPYEELSGISVPDVTVTAFASDAAFTCKGRAARMTGDLLFTHRGFSGPVILNISRYAEPGQLLRIKYNKELSELPRRMRKILEDRSRGPSGDIRTSKLAGLLDADDFTVESVDRRGMVTAGGICLECIDMATMQIKPGLYAVGEAVNADGITGGYNLQMCWSTAMTAADSIREKIY